MRMISVLVIASVITKVNLNIIKTKSSYENSQPFEQRFQKNLTDLVQEFLTKSHLKKEMICSH